MSTQPPTTNGTDLFHRRSAHTALSIQIAAVRAGDVQAAKATVERGVAASVRALVLARGRLLAEADTHSAAPMFQSGGVRSAFSGAHGTATNTTTDTTT